MADKFQHTYRISSARLQSWNYGWAAAYFVTICTKDREHYFGTIENGVMQLSNVGVIADIMWYEIKNHAKNIELGEFVVMPNHVHGIIELQGNGNDNANGSHVETGHALSLQQPNDPIIETGHALSLPEQQQTPGQQRFQNQGKNTLSSIIGGYKSAVTKHANRLHLNFAWQTRFHDHIIREEKSFQTISAYIANNPMNWKDDKFFK